MQRLTHSLCISLTFVAAFCVAGLTFAAPTPEDPFRPDITYADGTVTATFLLLQDGQHIYDAMLTCSLGAPATKPQISGKDDMGGDYYANLAEFTWPATPGQTFTLGYQGCDATMCHMPQELTFSITADGKVIEGALPAPGAAMQAPAVTEPTPEASQGGLHPAGRVCRLPARRATGGNRSVLLG